MAPHSQLDSPLSGVLAGDRSRGDWARVTILEPIPSMLHTIEFPVLQKIGFYFL